MDGFLGETNSVRPCDEQGAYRGNLQQLTLLGFGHIIQLLLGAVAQLGERVNGIHEVVGSIPISSITKRKGQGSRSGFSGPFCCARVLTLEPLCPLMKGGLWTLCLH